MPAPIEFTQGESVELTLVLTTEEGGILDIEGATFDAQIRNYNDLDTSLAVFQCIPNVATGEVLLTLQKEESMVVPHTVQYTAKSIESPVPIMLLFYDCFKTVVNHRKLVASGPVKVYPAMTRI